jgi:hypothetical protein
MTSSGWRGTLTDRDKEYDMDIKRIDKYTIRMGGRTIRADQTQEERIRNMDEEAQERFVKIMGGQVATEDPYYLGAKTFSMEVEVKGVDPGVLGLLTGGVLGTPPPPSFSIEVRAPIKRTFWQWLIRKPCQYNHYFIPNAVMGEVDDA